MGGALKSVFGGSGGIFGAVLGVASMFFPPLAVAGSLSNLLTSAIGQAVKMAASTLVKEFAMPKFLEALIGQVVDTAVSKLTAQNPTDPQVDQHVGEQAGGSMEQFTQQLTQQLVESVTKKIAEKSGGAAGGKNAKGAAVSSGSWLEALAVALGEAQGNKAAKLVQLADELKNLSGQQTSGSQDAKTQNAQQFTMKSQELQAVGQELSILQNAASNAIKTIGEALSQAVRKG
jgi:hypothetical protein